MTDQAAPSGEPTRPAEGQLELFGLPLLFHFSSTTNLVDNKDTCN